MAMSRAEKIAAAKKRHNFKRINTPRRGGPKKFEVLAVEGNEVRKINFGDPNMPIKKNNPAMMYVKRYTNPNPGKKPEVAEKPKAKPKKTYRRKKSGTATGKYSSDG